MPRLTTCHEPVLVCAFLPLTSLPLTGVRPSFGELSFLRPASFRKDLPGHMSVLFSPVLPYFSFANWFEPCSLF